MRTTQKIAHVRPSTYRGVTKVHRRDAEGAEKQAACVMAANEKQVASSAGAGPMGRTRHGENATSQVYIGDQASVPDGRSEGARAGNCHGGGNSLFNRAEVSVEFPAPLDLRSPLAEAENEPGRNSRVVLSVVGELGANVVYLDETQPDVPGAPHIEAAAKGHADSSLP